MVIQTNEKWSIKFDEEEKQYIYYRIMTKAELTAHKNEAEKQLANVTNAINQFQAYIDDERVEDEKP
jgi:hypothetical protein